MTDHSDSPRADAPAARTLPVIEEALSVGKVTHATGAVRVRIESRERIETVDGATVTSEVNVERITRNQVVEATRGPWNDGDTLVVPVYLERTVVRRELVLIEEIRLHTRTESRPERSQHSVREETAIVERQQPDGSWRHANDP